eukprot:4928257-Pleurochrysis_carterae.AAC.3
MSRREKECDRNRQREFEKEKHSQKNPKGTDRRDRFRSYAARAQICALAAGDGEYSRVRPSVLTYVVKNA